MRRFIFNYQTYTRFSTPVERHSFLLRCQPMVCNFQTLEVEQLIVEPSTRLHHDIDAFGNHICYGLATQPQSSFAFVSIGVVKQTPYLIESTQCAPFYKVESRQTQIDNVMKEMRIERSNSVVNDAMLISQIVRGQMEYAPLSTNGMTTASEALSQGKGVCQDFAQIMIALCRHNNIAARYATGLIEGEGETHAWVEVYDHGAWHGIDPTNNVKIEYGYIKLAHGRDALDCPVNRGTFIGQSTQTTSIRVSVNEI